MKNLILYNTFKVFDKELKKEYSNLKIIRFELSNSGFVPVFYNEDYLDNCLEELNNKRFDIYILSNDNKYIKIQL